MLAAVLALTVAAWPARAAEPPAVWEFAFSTVGHSGATLLMLEGTLTFDSPRGHAAGGGSLVAVEPSGRGSAGTWWVLSALGWTLPHEQIYRDRPRLDLDLLLGRSLPLPQAFSARLSFEMAANRPAAWVTGRILAPLGIPVSGVGSAHILRRPP